MENAKCMPTPPKRVGREFVRQYFTIMNKSPENLHCFYSDEASFIHDDVDPTERRTISVEGKMAIRDVMFERLPHYRHTSTKIETVDTIETLDDGLLVQINGEISYNEQPMRPFSQTFILIPKSPFQYFVQNDIFQYSDFDMPKSRRHSISVQTMTTEADWGTQCEEYIEPYEESVELPLNTRVDAAHEDIDRDVHENEVKLDTSDSGLSSDAEKAIMDIQSLNLKSILQEPRSLTKEAVMKRGLTPPNNSEGESTSDTDVKPTGDDLSKHRTQLFRDSCILTIGNVINPNIEFDDTNREEISASENEKNQENVDAPDASKNEGSNSGKTKYRKKKDKRKARMEIAKGKSLDESMEKVELNEPPVENIFVTEQKVTQVSYDDQSMPQSAPGKPAADNPMAEQTEPSPSPSPSPIPSPIPSPSPAKAFAQETPKAVPEMKTYADLAKTGKNDWVDELAHRRHSIDRNKSRPPLVRRASRTEKTTPPNDAPHGSRSSPRNDLLQVFVGNIPHSATEDDIGKMFSRFGRLTRIKLHSNPRRDWLPRFAFIGYENIQSVRQCLLKKGTFYWPENSPDGYKLNVNGDMSVDVWDDSRNRRPNKVEAQGRSRDLRQFSKNFVLDNKDSNNKRSPDLDANISDSVRTKNPARSTRS